MDNLLGGLLGSGSGYYGGGSYGSQSAYNAATAVLGTTSASSANPLGGFGSVLTPLLTTGLSALTGLVIQPAEYQAQLAQASGQAALADQTTATDAAISTNSITTIIFWAAIAFGIVLLFENFAKKA